MKQRLAIAATLLRAPQLLILDEPTNGLDPAGIRDIRTMVRALGESGVTVLLSSHILAEVQQVCHSVSIIGSGRLLASGAVEDLVGESSVRSFTVGVADPSAAADVLARARYRVRRDGSRLVVEGAPGPANLGEEIVRTLADAATSTSASCGRCTPTWSRCSCELTHDDALRAGPRGAA